MSKTISFIRHHKWAIILVLVALFLFYWYEMRPIMVYRNCATQASIDARMLLGNKAEMAKATPQGEAYNRLIEKNLYLRTDYESFLMKCLMYHGMQIVPVSEEHVPEEAVDEGAGQ